MSAWRWENWLAYELVSLSGHKRAAPLDVPLRSVDSSEAEHSLADCMLEDYKLEDCRLDNCLADHNCLLWFSYFPWIEIWTMSIVWTEHPWKH
jgi:hypothetical protein